MRSNDRITARRQLDKRLAPLRGSNSFARPPRGWIRAIRDALGMTAKQLGTRMGVSQPRIAEMERFEVSKTLTLESLERAAHAMDCQLVYALVPRKPLDTLVEERATQIAKARLSSTGHSMGLEDQSVDADDQELHLKKMIQKLVEKSGSELWSEE